jgi:hypothetical protein
MVRADLKGKDFKLSCTAIQSCDGQYEIVTLKKKRTDADASWASCRTMLQMLPPIVYH